MYFVLKSKFVKKIVKLECSFRNHIFSLCRTLTLYLPLQLEKNALGEWFSSVLLSSLHFRGKKWQFTDQKKTLEIPVKDLV